MMLKMKKWVAAVMVVALLGSVVGAIPVAAAPAGTGSLDGDWTYDKDAFGQQNTYYYYIEGHNEKGTPSPNLEIKVDMPNFQLVESEYTDEPSGTQMYEKYEGVENSDNVLYVGAKGEKITYTLEVPETGLYGLEMVYYPLAVIGTQYQFSLFIDGENPFIEANSCVINRVWKNETIVTDEFGDDLRPQPQQAPEWRTQFLYDQKGVHGTLKFYLEKGTREITLVFDGTPVLLKNLTFKQEPGIMSYQDYVSMHKQMGAKDMVEHIELFQAENYYRQSSAQLWPCADKTSSLTQPFSFKNIKLNYGGGSQWKQPGHWITWEINAPEDGFYNIGVKYKQGYLDGLFSSRRVYIDDVVPFKELDSVRFDYTTNWKNQLLGDENGAYSIYLTKGRHTITMENVIGDLSDTMGVLQTVVNELNELYLSIVMITGSSPDPYRDYYLDKQLPELPNDLKRIADILYLEVARLEEIVGSKGAESAYFDDVAFNLYSYADNIPDITYKGRLTQLKNDINGLSAKLTTYQEQALDIDYFAVVSAGNQMPKTTMNAWEWVVYQVKSFFASFAPDSAEKKEVESIRVWISTGIDQFEILKSIINDEFTPKYGIEVDLELNGGSLINALAGGTGPDVMLGQGSTQVVNLALRDAVVDLSQFEGFDEILSQYIPGSEIPFTLEGRCYGIPSTNGCTVMFVRTDIFENMGLKIPETWDDVYDVAQVLQRYNMNLGAVPSFATLLYQNGGSYFNEDLTEVEFDTDVAVDALVQHAEFYTKYGFPVTYDFANRFRTGEMPIGLADYTTYNTLKYTAPEISGLWEMFPMPGTRMPDGTIDSTQMDQTGVGAIMLKSSLETPEKTEAAWTLIKWWSEAETQTRYATDLEAALGIAARRATANLETLKNIGWTTKERTVLEEQFKNLKFIPIVPGNYYVTRGLTNSIRGVVDHGENARELLSEWTIKINAEILRKRNEFFMNLDK